VLAKFWETQNKKTPSTGESEGGPKRNKHYSANNRKKLCGFIANLCQSNGISLAKIEKFHWAINLA
jgi:hypothetical protein